MNKNKHLQQCILALICVICFLQMATPSSAQPAATGASAAWLPTKNVEIIHGSAPGGSNDKRAREIEKALTETKLIPTSMTVVSKAGGGGYVALAYANTHAGDGHYIVLAGSTLISNHILGTSKLHYSELTPDRKSTRLNSSHDQISYAVFFLIKRRQPRSTLFPYTTLFRSLRVRG